MPPLRSVPNQGNEWSCTAYAICNIINAFKYPKWASAGLERTDLNGSEFFHLVNSEYPADLQGALTPPMALNYAQKAGYISTFHMLKAPQLNRNTLNQLLAIGAQVMIVVNRVNREQTDQTGIITWQERWNLAHTMAIHHYEASKDAYLVMNSYGEEWWNGGYCYLKAEDVAKLSQAYVVMDSDDSGKFHQLLYTTKIRSVVHTLSEQWKYGTEKEQKAMNFANTMLRKICLWQDHQWNMSKEQVLDFVRKHF